MELHSFPGNLCMGFCQMRTYEHTIICADEQNDTLKGCTFLSTSRTRLESLLLPH